MNRVLVTILVAALLAVPAPPAPAAPAAAATPAASTPERAERRGTVLDGVRVHLRRGTRQVITVNHTGGYRARVTLHLWRGGRWHAVRTTQDGRIGYGGLVRGDRRRQDTGTTPLGTYGLPWTFGTHPRQPGWDLRHREIQRGDYWVQDNRSRWYNRYRNISRGGFRPGTSERLTDFRQQYEYVVVMDFNHEQVRHRGAGIFLHVNGSGATAGCVSAPRRFLQRVMARLDPDRTPVIAVGR